jgi:hypothetical protein
MMGDYQITLSCNRFVYDIFRHVKAQQRACGWLIHIAHLNSGIVEVFLQRQRSITFYLPYNILYP